MEKQFDQSRREAIAALREIRDRKLFREVYSNFDEYMAARWMHTRQWATQQFNWLRRTELLEASGKNSYRLTVDDAQTLGELEDHPEAFVRAIEEAEKEAKRLGQKRTGKLLKDAVNKQSAFIKSRDMSDMPADLSYEEHGWLADLGDNRQPDLIEKAKARSVEENRPLADCLIDVCEKAGGFPQDADLLSVARGEALCQLVTPLQELKVQCDERADLLHKQQSLQRQLVQVERQLSPESDEVEEEEQDEEQEDVQDEPKLEYEVELTGDFETWTVVVSESYTLTEVENLFADIAEKLKLKSVSVVSSVTVTPLAQESESDDE